MEVSGKQWYDVHVGSEYRTIMVICLNSPVAIYKLYVAEVIVHTKVETKESSRQLVAKYSYICI